MKNNNEIKLLGISASPRHGNSEFLLGKAINGAKLVMGIKVKTELYSFVNKTFNPCISCFYCHKSGECKQQDDFKDLMDKWFAADAIVYSVPVYHLGMPAQLKAFIDRLGSCYFSRGAGKPIKTMKVIGTIAQGCHIFSGQEHTIEELNNHSILMGGIPVAGDLWESYTGVGAWTDTDIGRGALEKLYKRDDRLAVVSVNSATQLGKRVVILSAIVKSGIQMNLEIIGNDPAYSLILSKIIKGGSSK